MGRMLWMVCVAMGCRSTVTFDTPIPVDDRVPRNPASGDELARIEAAAAYSEAHKGRAFMVLRGDEVVFEEGQNGHGLDEPHHLFSGTKSFSCALFELARERGAFEATTSVSETLASVPAEVTVDHVLHLTSGIEQDQRRLSWDFMRENPNTDDVYAATLEQPFIHGAGDTFEYGSAHFNLFGALVTEHLGDPVEVLQEGVFDAIGLRTAGWLRDPAGNPALGLGAFTTANEWAKYGLLVRDDGVFLGNRVMPPGLHDCLAGSSANPAYGRTFWLNQAVSDEVELVAPRRLESSGPIISNDGPADLVSAAGHHDQRLYVIPSLDLVIVRLGDGGWGFKDRDLLAPFFD